MGQEYNFFALLGDEEGDDVSQLINGVNQEEKKKSAMVKKVQKEKKEDQKKMAQPIPSDMRAKPLVLPTHVRRSFIVFDKKTEREKAEAESKRKAKEDPEARDSVKNDGDSNTIVAAEDKDRGQPVMGNFVASNNSNGGESNTSSLSSYQGGHRGGDGLDRRNGGNYNYQRNNGGAHVYQQSKGYNGFYKGNRKSANGHQPNSSDQYQGNYREYNGNQRYKPENKRVLNGEDPNANVADDGWQYVGRRKSSNRQGTDQELISHGQHGTKHDSLEESKNSQKGSANIVSGANNGDITVIKDLAGLQSVKDEAKGQLSVTTEGNEDAQSEKKSTEGKDVAKCEKKSKKNSKKKNKDKEIQDNFEKKDVKKEEEKKNLMTLEEYEKKKLEDRKNLETSKRPEQRLVEDKEFQSMELIGKKKEDSQPKSEDKLKKKDNIKEEKVSKTLITEEFFKQPPYWWLRQRWNGDGPDDRRDIESTNREGNEERRNGKYDGGRKPSGQGDEDRHTNGNSYGRPSGRRDGGRPNGKGDEERSNGRFGGHQRANRNRDGERPGRHGPGPSAPLAAIPPIQGDEGRKPSEQGDGDRHTNGNGYRERERERERESPSARHNGGRPSGKSDGERSNGRFGGSQRANRKRDGDSDGEKPSGHRPGPSAPTAPTPPTPTFDIEHHHFPSLR